jgi:sugar/nucleoside kinase (ribokinase family)
MARVWVLGTASWDDVLQLDSLPVAGGRAVARVPGRRPGGSSANVARALSSAGHEVSLVTEVGDDPVGRELLEELATWGIDTSHIVRRDNCTAETMILIDSKGERTIIVVDKDCAAKVPVPYSKLLEADCVYVGNYDDYDPQLPSSLEQSQALVMASVPPQREAAGWRAHLIIGSSDEYPQEWMSNPFAYVRRFTGPELQWVLVTNGRAGAMAHGPDGAIRIPPAPAREVDSTGAGDAFAAGVLHGLLQGSDLLTAGRLGSRWGAVALQYFRSVPPRWDELDLGDPSADWAQRLNAE